MVKVIEGTITISLARYYELVEDEMFLAALRNAGVESWEGFDFAIEIYEEQAGK